MEEYVKCINIIVTIFIILLQEIFDSTKSRQAFVALDDWLKETAMRNGKVEYVLESFRKNIVANIQYYKYLAEELESKNDKFLAPKYRLVSKLYEGMLQSR